MEMRLPPLDQRVSWVSCLLLSLGLHHHFPIYSEIPAGTCVVFSRSCSWTPCPSSCWPAFQRAAPKMLSPSSLFSSGGIFSFSVSSNRRCLPPSKANISSHRSNCATPTVQPAPGWVVSGPQVLAGFSFLPSRLSCLSSGWVKVCCTWSNPRAAFSNVDEWILWYAFSVPATHTKTRLKDESSSRILK